MEHIINCPDCGTNLEFRMFEVLEGVLEETNVCEECGYGYPSGHWFWKDHNLVTKISCEIEMAMLWERAEILRHCVSRDWYPYEAPIQYLEELDPKSDDENTLWEQWFLEGMKKAMEIVEAYKK